MANLYFPGCKVKGDFPAASEKLAAYIQSKRVVTPVGCCRVDHDKLTPADTAVVVCNNCANIIAESGDPGQIEFVWEIIDNDPEFPFPDYHGDKMNIDVVELAENHEKTRFCGMNLVAPCNPSNAKLAPKRYVEEGGHMFQPIPPEEQAAYFQSYCAQFTTDRVVCYCKSCRGGLLKGGKKALHILELLFPEE